MSDDQITTLAREYAEENVKQPEDMSNSLHNEYLKLFADEAEELIRFLLRRYCLVEKSKVESVYNTTWNSWYHTLDVGTKGKNQCVLDVLHFLFPEIAKEVEG